MNRRATNRSVTPSPLHPFTPSSEKGINPADLIRAELDGVEAVLIAQAASEFELLEEATRHILQAGGKPLRPQLLILSARAMAYPGGRGIPLAAAMELVHTATLGHD